VPYCWCLGGDHGIRVLLDSRDTQDGRSLTFEKAASSHERELLLLRLLYSSAAKGTLQQLYSIGTASGNFLNYRAYHKMR
ncbi:MAG TPA: hypothetical protein VKR42_11810, partial [Ktedonobacteraceae bacterium]|nr:hypothetical protein [Ktedonobacteraceae bacterium]